ncbi:MAG: 50S ribosomal protein L31 [bacterium]|nr:50S ribosomal protein L31 [bacterium]
MKKDIHPKYVSARSAASAATWSTPLDAAEDQRGDLLQLPPYFTGQQKIVDTAGRIERLKRYQGVYGDKQN